MTIAKAIIAMTMTIFVTSSSAEAGIFTKMLVAGGVAACSQSVKCSAKMKKAAETGASKCMTNQTCSSAVLRAKNNFSK